jgi:hypothetical protein
MNLTKLLFWICLVLVLPVGSFAQKHWEVSATVGAMNYYGDLTPPLFTIKEVHAGGQLSVRRYFNREHAVRFNVLHGVLSGDDHNFDRNYLRGNRFTGKMTEVSLLGEFDVKGRKRFSKKHGYQKTNSLYFFGGASVAYFDPKVTYGAADSKDKDIDYVNWHIGMPIGGGLRVDANERLVFGLELAYRFTISDFLDGTQASGNAYKNDSYTFGGVSVGYRFFGKEKQEEATETK